MSEVQLLSRWAIHTALKHFRRGARIRRARFGFESAMDLPHFVMRRLRLTLKRVAEHAGFSPIGAEPIGPSLFSAAQRAQARGVEAVMHEQAHEDQPQHGERAAQCSERDLARRG
jgi:hypothetical protein